MSIVSAEHAFRKSSLLMSAVAQALAVLTLPCPRDTKRRSAEQNRDLKQSNRADRFLLARYLRLMYLRYLKVLLPDELYANRLCWT